MGGEQDLSADEVDAVHELHPAIKAECARHFANGDYAVAVEKSFKLVRERLRELTGYETGSDAFSRAGLHIRGAVAEHVDADFNEGMKFLTMAIDRFRNEKAHTACRLSQDGLGQLCIHLMCKDVLLFGRRFKHADRPFVEAQDRWESSPAIGA